MPATLHLISPSGSSLSSLSTTSQSCSQVPITSLLSSRPSSMKSYFKDKFSKKSNTTSSGNNPFGSNPSPPTRRPGAEAPPPSYAEATRPTTVPRVPTVVTDDDPFEFLEDFDTVIVIDDSASMISPAKGNFEMRQPQLWDQTRWNQVSDCLSAIVPICTRYDSDGIDLHFINRRSRAPAPEGKPADGFYNITTAEGVRNIFSEVQPCGGTKTGLTLRRILTPYMARYRRLGSDWSAIKPMNIIVITDGAAKDDLEGTIKEFAKKLDDNDAPSHQVGIQFFQVGEWDGATEALHQLDDGISNCRDMVDTVTFDASKSGSHCLTADAILKTVLGAVNRRLDRKTLSAVQGKPRRSASGIHRFF